jgi:hypothetical protein
MILTDFYLINIRSFLSGNKIIKSSFSNRKLLSQKYNLLQKNSKRYNYTKMSAKNLIAICQITCKADKQENYNTCKSLITSAVRDGAKVLFIISVVNVKYDLILNLFKTIHQDGIFT